MPCSHLFKIHKSYAYVLHLRVNWKLVTKQGEELQQIVAVLLFFNLRHVLLDWPEPC